MTRERDLVRSRASRADRFADDAAITGLVRIKRIN